MNKLWQLKTYTGPSPYIQTSEYDLFLERVPVYSFSEKKLLGTGTFLGHNVRSDKEKLVTKAH